MTARRSLRRVRRAAWCGVTLAMAGCGASAGTAGPPTVRVVGVSSDGCSLIPALSSGFVIDGGWVVTVAHATRGSNTIDVDGSPAELVAIDLRSDVAILRPSATDDSDAPAMADAAVGDPVTVIVRRDGGPQRLEGSVSRTPTINFEEPTDHTYYRRGGLILTGVTIAKGDSGSPVVGRGGDIVGMMFAMSRERGLGYAVDADEIAAMIPAAGTLTVDSGKC